MKKQIFSIVILFLLLLISGCKTPPIERSIQNLNKPVQPLQEPQIKLYFPQFGIFDVKKNEEIIVGGDGIIIILPDGKCMIIDSFEPGARYDMVCFLEQMGITKIDYLIATHYHKDHIGSMPSLIEYFDIGKFYSNGVDFASAICFELLDSAYEKDLEVNVLKQGDTLILSEEPEVCKIDVLWPKEQTKEDKDDAYWRPGPTQKLKNNTSLVFKLIYKDFSVMFTGDVYKNCDRIITAEYGKQLESTIMKVAHHGEFYTSNSPDFVKAVNADYGVIQNPYYMINPIITGIYKKSNTRLLYRTTPGYILIESDGINYNITEETF